jgi:C4-type Zn-finger protein
MNKNLETMVKKIESYSKDEQLNILKIILKDNHSHYSENNNGTFIKMDKLDVSIIHQIEEYIKYIEKKEEDINSVEDKMNEIKKDLNI